MLADVLASNSDGPPTQAFIESYGQLLQWITDNCGFASLDLVATNYAYGGIANGDQIPAGVTVIHLDNQADEYHEIALYKRNEGTTETSTSCWRCPTRRSTQGHDCRHRLRRARHRRRHGRRSDPGRLHRAVLHPQGHDPGGDGRDIAAAGSAPEGSAPTGSRRPTALHARHARRVHGGRGWRGHDRLRRDDDDVDGHDAGHHRLTTQHPFQQPAARHVPRAARDTPSVAADIATAEVRSCSCAKSERRRTSGRPANSPTVS